MDAKTSNGSSIKAICTYLGSNPGTDSQFRATACAWGKILAENGIRLVCGGGGRGLMKELVASVLNNGGLVTSVTPEFLLEDEGNDPRIQDPIVVPNMHVRKQIMFDRADAFVALSGGVGTLEELVEQLTWRQLGRHTKPIVIANVESFYDPLFEMFDKMRRKGLITKEQPIDPIEANRIEDVLPLLRGEMTCRTRPVHEDEVLSKM